MAGKKTAKHSKKLRRGAVTKQQPLTRLPGVIQ